MCGCNHQTGYVCYRHRDSYRDPLPAYPEPLAEWEKELLRGDVATVTFTRTDGKTLSFDHVNVDSIGPSAENPGVVGVEFENDSMRVVHVPFVQSWEITYN